MPAGTERKWRTAETQRIAIHAMKNGLSFRRIPTGPYPGKMSFASEEERQSAAKLLEEDNDPGPSKTGIGGSTPKVKKK